MRTQCRVPCDTKRGCYNFLRSSWCKMCRGVVTEDWKKADDNEYLRCFLPRMSTQVTPGYYDNPQSVQWIVRGHQLLGLGLILPLTFLWPRFLMRGRATYCFMIRTSTLVGVTEPSLIHLQAAPRTTSHRWHNLRKLTRFIPPVSPGKD